MRDSRPPITTAMRLRWRGSRAMGASTRPLLFASSPVARAMYLFFTCRSFSWSDKDWWACWVLATTISPEVSLSNRCTIPGRMTPPMPFMSGHRASNPLTSVRSGWPGPGWTERPGGLSITTISSSWYTRVSGIHWGVTSIFLGGGTVRDTRSPRRTLWEGFAKEPFSLTCPSTINRWSWARVNPERVPARNWSRRTWPTSTVNCLVVAGGAVTEWDLRAVAPKAA